MSHWNRLVTNLKYYFILSKWIIPYSHCVSVWDFDNGVLSLIPLLSLSRHPLMGLDDKLHGLQVYAHEKTNLNWTDSALVFKFMPMKDAIKFTNI